MYSNIKNLFHKCSKIINRKFYKYFYFYFFLSIIGGILEILSIGMIIPLLTVVTDQFDNNSKIILYTNFFRLDDQNLLIIFFAVSLVIIYLIKNIFIFKILNFQLNIATKIQTEMSNNLFENYFKSSYQFHKQKNSSELIRDIMAETTQFTRGLIFNFLSLSLNLFLSLFIIVFLFITDFNSTLIVTAFSLIFGISFLKYFKKQITLLGKERVIYSNLQIKSMQEASGNFKEIKLMGKLRNLIEKFKISNAKVFEIIRKNSLINVMPRLMIEVLIVLLLMSLLIYYLNIDYNIQDIIIIMGILAACGIKLIPLSSSILNSLNMVVYSKSSVDVLFEYVNQIEKQKNINVKNDRYKFIDHFDHIEFKNVSFKYSNENTFELENINLSIFKGDKVGIIGKTGSGKSTLLDLTLGLLKPSEGKILINGEDFSTFNLNWKNILGYVPQNIYLLDDTIKNNIILSDDKNYNEKELENVLIKSCINEFIINLPNKINTIVGENGTRISGGQKQRIGIARALLKSNQLLVLDEATSAIDIETESKLLKNIFSTNKTVIFITHRLENLKYCNKVIDLNNKPIIIKNKSS